MFLLCFFVWAVVVDTVFIPKSNHLSRRSGTYSRYRVKQWGGKVGRVDLMKDELLVYAHIKGREQLFYVERKPHFEAVLGSLNSGSSIQIRYFKGFPKIWKKELYELQVDGYAAIRYSPVLLKEKQIKVLKFSGIMVGIFLFLAALGFVNKPRRK